MAKKIKAKKIKIGMGQLLVEGGEPYRNLKRATEMVKEAAKRGCHIIVLPETLDLGWTHPSAKTKSRPIPGPYSDLLCKAAKKHKIYVCGGLTERDRDKVYNAAILISPSGEIILKYRKINELSVALDLYSIGNSLSVVETELGTIGVNICADNYHNSLVIGHTLARMGAQIILSPSSWTVPYTHQNADDPYGTKWEKPFRTLAELYDLTIVGTTSVGILISGIWENRKSIGCSIAVNEHGVIAKALYNEFAGDLVVAETKINESKKIGTDIPEMIDKKGYVIDTFLKKDIEKINSTFLSKLRIWKNAKKKDPYNVKEIAKGNESNRFSR